MLIYISYATIFLLISFYFIKDFMALLIEIFQKMEGGISKKDFSCVTPNYITLLFIVSNVLWIVNLGLIWIYLGFGNAVSYFIISTLFYLLWRNKKPNKLLKNLHITSIGRTIRNRIERHNSIDIRLVSLLIHLVSYKSKTKSH